MINLRERFNISALKTRGLTLLIEHSPCCLLSLAAGFIGIAALNHNPVLELGFALGGALLGDHIGHKYFNKECCDTTRKGRAKRYALALSFGLASWGVHQAIFHDHSAHTYHHPAEIHDCNHKVDNTQPSFAPHLQQAARQAHQELHDAACTPNQ